MRRGIQDAWLLRLTKVNSELGMANPRAAGTGESRSDSGSSSDVRKQSLVARTLSTCQGYMSEAETTKTSRLLTSPALPFDWTLTLMPQSKPTQCANHLGALGVDIDVRLTPRTALCRHARSCPLGSATLAASELVSSALRTLGRRCSELLMQIMD